MFRFAISFALGAMMLLLAPITEAARFNVSLNGASENPANPSPGIGNAFIITDPAAHRLTVHVNFTGLVAGTTASHIHCCIAPFGNAGVATTTPTFAGFPLGVTSGTYDVVLDLTQASSFNPAFVTANGGTVAGAEAALLNGINAGLAYLNIHSSTYPGGEIRGWLNFDGGLLVVPTLSEWTLAGLVLALGIATLIAVRRRTAS